MTSQTITAAASGTCIPGTGDPDHLAANVAAGALRLSEDDLAVLDSLHQGEGRASRR